VPVLTFLLFFSLLKSGAQPVAQHHITAELDDIRHAISASDSLIYLNTTRDTLYRIRFSLYPNVLQPGSILDRQLLRQGNTTLAHAPIEQQGAITGLIFRSEGRALRWEYDPFDTGLCEVQLLKPLPPGGSVTFLIFFRVAIPEKSSGMMGHGSQSYFLSEWFPKPLIRDTGGVKMNPMYLDGAARSPESSFRVTITLPKNYVVAASGILAGDPEEEKWLANLEEKTRKMNRWGRKEQAAFPVSAQKTKTLTYTLLQAEDFAFCADKRFFYLYDTLHDGHSGKVISLHLLFTSFEASQWSRSTLFIKDALRYMTDKAGAYPYPQLTLVQTPWENGGSSHPGLIRLGSFMSEQLLQEEIIRQIASQWFGTSLSLDRNDDYWFHKGLSGYYAARFLRDRHRDTLFMQGLLLDTLVRINVAGLKSHPWSRLDYFRFAWLLDEELQPTSTPADGLTRKNFVAVGQLRSAMTFNTLAGLMGEEAFDGMMRGFYAEWQGKFPEYLDFINYVERSSGRGALLQSLLVESALPDFAVSGCKKTAEGYQITLKNRSRSKTPYPVTLSYPGYTQTQWIPGHEGTYRLAVADTGHSLRKITIDRDYQIPELHRSDNTIRTTGFLRRIEKPRLTLGAALPDMDHTRINYFPVVGWNAANGAMAGLALYSNPLIRPATEYLVMPMFGFLNRQPAGIVRIQHAFRINEGPVSRVEAAFEAKRFGLLNQPSVTYYQRFAPSVMLQIRKRNPLDPARHRWMIRSLWFSRGEPSLVDSAENIWRTDHQSRWYVNEISWRYRNTDPGLPFRSAVSLQQSEGLIRAFGEATMKFPYRKGNKGFSVRSFAGMVVMKPSGELPWDYRFSTAGVAMQTRTYFRPHDPLFDQLYLGRNNAEGILRQHFYPYEGGFKRATTVGNTERWMWTVNLSTAFPGRIPAELWLDAGIFADDSQDEFFKGVFLFSSGVKLILVRDVAEICFPFTFFESEAIREREKLNNINPSYLQTIRFVLNLPVLNPLLLPGRVRL